MQVFFIVAGVLALIALGFLMKVRSMPQYKKSKEKDHDGKDKWFVKIRKGLSYYYLEQIHDAPGFEDDIFKTSKYQSGPQETEALADKIIINHRMTTVNGIEREGV
jgi:hypothetical protein